ncbi:MAG: hypothetical protein GTO12_12805 [Proteobacteria bacterium]|nr:hypothetical protein [Pseudomonadota bacterium]
MNAKEWRKYNEGEIFGRPGILREPLPPARSRGIIIPNDFDETSEINGLTQILRFSNDDGCHPFPVQIRESVLLS